MAATDATLVCGAQKGDQAAFVELYDRRAKLIRAICLDATHDFDTAAELTQEVFLRAYEKLSTLRTAERFVPWLVGIARRVCRDWLRGRRRERRRFTPLVADPPAPTDPSDQRVELLDTALQELPEKERMCLHAFYAAGMTVDEARAVLGLSRSGLYRVLDRARRRLRRILTQEEADS